MRPTDPLDSSALVFRNPKRGHRLSVRVMRMQFGFTRSPFERFSVFPDNMASCSLPECRLAIVSSQRSCNEPTRRSLHQSPQCEPACQQGGPLSRVTRKRLKNLSLGCRGPLSAVGPQPQALRLSVKYEMSSVGFLCCPVSRSVFTIERNAASPSRSRLKASMREATRVMVAAKR